jgi:hypothetical protein
MLRTKILAVVVLCGVMTTGGAEKRVEEQAKARRGRAFVALRDWTPFQREENAEARTVTLTSPELPTEIAAKEIVVSWNVSAPKESGLKVEAMAKCGERETRWYTLGLWSPDGKTFPRESVKAQKDGDGNVETDILVLNKPAEMVKVRVTLHAAPDGRPPILKFLGVSLADTTETPPERESNREVWGKEVVVPGKPQSGWPGASGWCSPTSVSMALAYWAKKLDRPELDIPVPDAARATYDSVYRGTGNWPFNTAFAGALPGIRAYVTRLSDMRELEDWIAAGIPPVVSVSYDLLKGMQRERDPGHLMVCTGFTKEGDIVLNDPAHRPGRGEVARSVYPRSNFLRAWKRSEYTVYLLYPEGAKLPPDPCGHWE